MDPNFTKPCLMLPQLNYMKYVITTFCELELFLMFSQLKFTSPIPMQESYLAPIPIQGIILD